MLGPGFPGRTDRVALSSVAVGRLGRGRRKQARASSPAEVREPEVNDETSTGSDGDGSRRRPGPAAIGWTVGLLAVAAVVLVVGLGYLGGIEWKVDTPRERLSYLAVYGGALGVVVFAAVRFWKHWLGLAGAALAVLGFVGAMVVLPEGIAIDTFGEGDRVRTAAADELPAIPGPVEPEPSPLLGQPDGLDGLELGVEVVAEGLVQPVKVLAVPESQALLVVEREGRVRLVESDGTVVDEPILDISAETVAENEEGLLSGALDPAGERLYLSYTDLEHASRISSWEFDGTSVDPASRIDHIRVSQPYETHNGGDINFGRDGYLYFGLGDGGLLRDPHDLGQDRTNLQSTIIRILPTDDPDEPYLIPPDNPYLDLDGVWPEIYVYGTRNPWRWSFDRVTGDLWVGDVGQSEFEEVHFLPYGHTGGANFGWSLMVGDKVYGAESYEGPDFDRPDHTVDDRPADHVDPIFTYEQDYDEPRGARNSITGGYVYRGTAIPELWGTYVYNDFSARWYGAVLYDPSTGTVVDDARLDLGEDVPVGVSFGEDADGEILIVDIAGQILRIVPA